LDFDLSYENRFGGLTRILGNSALEILRSAKIALIGLGGVGSWAAESLVRSGIGTLYLFDLDDSCVTNTNRQLHALDGNYGSQKVALMADRFKKINPEAHIEACSQFVNAATVKRLLSADFDFVIDAIDLPEDKACIYAHCRELGLPLVMSGGSGGRTDPSQIQISDLMFEQGDPLLKATKKKIRDTYKLLPVSTEEAFLHAAWTRIEGPAKSRASGDVWNALCVWSREKAVMPWDVCSAIARPGEGGSSRIDCAQGFGALSFLTGAFGLGLASVIVRYLCLAKA